MKREGSFKGGTVVATLVIVYIISLFIHTLNMFKNNNFNAIYCLIITLKERCNLERLS